VRLFFLFFLCTIGAIAQEIDPSNFVIDQSKPYVFLKFDHIGPRKAAQHGEENIGLWLKVVNNCRIPIVLGGHNALAGDPGYYIDDEVIEEAPSMITYVKTEKEMEIGNKSGKKTMKSKPLGYSSSVAGVIRIQPGEDVLVSFPINHVDDDWYLRVKVALAINKSSIAAGPFTYLPFFIYDIPKQFRTR
jgi:hypothetical protein